MAATKTDLKDSVAQDEFREDLYFRLQVAEIRIPVSTSSLSGYAAHKQKLINIQDVYNDKELAAIDPDLKFELDAISPDILAFLRNIIERIVSTPLGQEATLNNMDIIKLFETVHLPVNEERDNPGGFKAENALNEILENAKGVLQKTGSEAGE